MRDWMIYLQVLTAYGLIDRKDFVICARRSHIKNQGFCNTAHAWRPPWRKKRRDFFLESRETAEAFTVVVKWAWKKSCSLVDLPLLYSLYTWEEILRDEAKTRAIRRWSWFATNPLGPSFFPPGTYYASDITGGHLQRTSPLASQKVKNNYIHFGREWNLANAIGGGTLFGVNLCFSSAENM